MPEPIRLLVLLLFGLVRGLVTPSYDAAKTLGVKVGDLSLNEFSPVLLVDTNIVPKIDLQ